MNCRVINGKNSNIKPIKEVSGLNSSKNIGIYCMLIITVM